jgi:hypothetical protein
MKLIFSLSFFVFFQFGLYSQSSFSAQLNIPEDVVQGETCIFELELYKPQNVSGYTVFKQAFPKGFYVKKIDTKGAEFLYKENELTLTWLRTPADSKISVKYEVSPMYGVTGKFAFSGQLTYMIGNNQGKFDLKESVLSVLKEKKPVKNDSNTYDYYTVIQLNKKLHKDISCVRELNFNKNKNEYIIEVIIKKKGNGSYHLIEYIPKAYTFEEMSSSGAKLSIQKDKASFFWGKTQANKDIHIKYKLIPQKDQTKEPFITGKLSVFKNGQMINLPVLN